MTAIAGIWNLAGQPGEGAACKSMLAAQRLFGPDDLSAVECSPIALGRALHRLLPEDRQDRQPLSGAGGRFLLVADIRLDNRAEIARALRIDAVTLPALCDADLLLVAWERWETEVFQYLLGDYAFAVWDRRDRKLTLARDHVGARPLHYSIGHHFVAFASMPRGLHALPELPYAPDKDRIAELLLLFPETGERSFFEGICRVEAGHYVTVTTAGARSVRYWNPPAGARQSMRYEDAVQGIRAHLDDAVEARLRRTGADVATHLSAGLDSSAVTATAARLAGSAGKVVAFTAVPRIGYVDPKPHRRIGDESTLAGETARHYPAIEHVLVPTEPGTPLDTLDRDFHLFDRPVQNLCNQRWYARINTLAAQRGLKVLLTGASGNFSATYPGVEALAGLAGGGKFLRLARLGSAAVRSGSLSRKQVLEKSFGPWLPESLWMSARALLGRPLLDPARYSAIDPRYTAEARLDLRARTQGFDLHYAPFRDPHRLRLWSLTRVDMGNYNKGMLGGWGIDHRDPMADRRLVEFCLSLPPEHFMHGGRPRALGVAALRDRLPAAVLDERRRGMQAVDWHEGVDAARPMIREEIGRLRHVPGASELIDLERMERLIDEWPDPEDWHASRTVQEYRLALIRGVAAGHFLRKASRTNA